MSDYEFVNGEKYIKVSSVREYLESNRDERIPVEGMAYEDNVNIDETINDLGF